MKTSYLHPAEHAQETQGGPLLWTAEKGRRKGTGSEAGLESKSPDTQVKEQHLSVASFKNEVEKILEACGQQTVITYMYLSSLLNRGRRMKKRGSRASAISSNSR